MADETEIYKRLNEIFRDIFDDDSINLTPETTAADIPEWDSFNHVNISVACEAAFGIRFKAAELEELRNVGELVHFIEQKLG
jgi:acyl carrier protein